MAIIPKFIVLAPSLPVNTSATFAAGMFLAFDSNGNVADFVTASAAAGSRPAGLAGDTKSTSTASIPETNEVNIGADGTAASLQNRVSDTFDETKASGKATVYMKGGIFSTDQYGTITGVGGTALYCDINGKLTSQTAGAGVRVGTLLEGPGAYDSGVPGVDAINDEDGVTYGMSLGNYVTFTLDI